MTQHDFAESLERELQARCVPFDQAELLDFAKSVWPLAAEEADPVRWADEFLQAVRETAAR